MADNPLTLFCVTVGDTILNAFPVSIPSTDTVGILKNLIKDKKTNDFSDVDADKLSLWRASIPITDDYESPILLENLTDKEKLLPRTYISAVFTDDSTYIVVQRPQP
ncbi:hypothetical protein BGZ81_010920, partial [Podila clonocystis]